MIQSFGNKLARHLFHGIQSKETRQFPKELHRSSIRKLTQLDICSSLETLTVPPGNRLEALTGDWKGFHSIRINDPWRICFRWTDDGPVSVQVVDYH